MNDFTQLLLVILIYSLVQSILGVGLLVFGTPTLLLMGLPFDKTMAILLPCSILISSIQTWEGRDDIRHLKKFIWPYTLPMVLLGLYLVLNNYLDLDIKLIVGVMLLFTGLIRFSSRLQNATKTLLKKSFKFYLVVMGFVHGVSNMGGGLLTILVTTMYDEKKTIRTNVAFGYLTMGLIQVVTLAIMHPQAFSWQVVPLALCAGATYKLVGNRVFNVSSDRIYHHLITGLTFAYGLILMR